MLEGLVHIGGAGGTRSAPTDLVDDARWDALAPRFATVYVENKCHLTCAHCYENPDTHPHDARLSLADYEKVFDDLARLGVLYLSLTGGEIFLRGDLFDIIALARQKRFAVRLYTSGTLIDEARADRIRDLKVSEVQVSLYSADARVHDEFVGQSGAHGKTVRALQLLRARGVLTVVKATAMTINIDGLEALADLAASLGADVRIDSQLHPRTGGDPQPLRYQVPAEELQRKLLAHPRLFAAFEKSGSEDSSAQRICSGDAGRGSGDTLCAAGRAVVSVSADGAVLPCALFPISGGNVKDRSLVEIWRRSRLFHDVRAATFGHMTACQTCHVKSSCDPCMAYAIIENGDHRQCNAASLNLATALRGLAEDRVRRDARSARDEARADDRHDARHRRVLPIIGSRCAPRPQRSRAGCGG